MCSGTYGCGSLHCIRDSNDRPAAVSGNHSEKGAWEMIWLYLINHILEATELYYYTFCLYPHIRRKRQEFLSLFASYTVLFSIFVFFENYNLNILCNIVIITFLLKYITPAGILDSIKHSLLTIMTVIISELLFDIPTVLFHIDTSFPYPNLGTLLIGTLIIHIIHIVIIPDRTRESWFPVCSDYPPDPLGICHSPFCSFYRHR